MYMPECKLTFTYGNGNSIVKYAMSDTSLLCHHFQPEPSHQQSII